VSRNMSPLGKSVPTSAELLGGHALNRARSAQYGVRNEGVIGSSPIVGSSENSDEVSLSDYDGATQRG